jgi:hypothetical protein
MNNVKFGQTVKWLPILTPADIVDAATKTLFVDLKGANWATLALHFGAITCDVPTVTVKCSTAATSTGAIAVAFKYRLSSVIATEPDSWGAITSATTTGVALAVTDDGGVLEIDIDPADIAVEGADYRYLHALITPAADTTVCVVGAQAFIEPSYPGNSIPVVRTT